MGTVHFIGSKDRLQRIITRSNGTILPDRRFKITMQDYTKKIPGFSFIFRCTWENTDNGIHISYKVYPTLFTLVTFLLQLLIFSLPVITANTAETMSLLLPLMVILSFLGQMRACIVAFCKLFSVPTTIK